MFSKAYLQIVLKSSQTPQEKFQFGYLRLGSFVAMVAAIVFAIYKCKHALYECALLALRTKTST